MRKLVFLFLLSLLFSQAALAFNEIDESLVFPAVAQGQIANNSNCNSGNSNNRSSLTMYNGTRITGTGGRPLDFCTVNSGSGLPNDSCDDGAGGFKACSVSSNQLRGISLGNFQGSNGSGGSINFCNAGQQLNLGANGNTQFGSISLYNTCTLTMSATNSEYRFNSIAIGSGAKIIFPAGDYWIKSLQLNANSQIELQGRVRIFVEDSGSQFNGGTLNPTNQEMQLFGFNSMTLTGSSLINGLVYVNNTLTLNNDSVINGRVTVKDLVMNPSSRINDAAATPQPFHLQYGKASSGSVTFDTAFPDGTTPLVFLMPTVSQTNSNSDGPASVFVQSVSTTGFTWQQREPESPANRYTPSNPMTDVHWIAVTPGTHALANGTDLIAGTVEYNQALFGSNSPYIDVTLPSTQNVLLNQIQTRNNDCWFTSTSQFTNSGIELALDSSEVRDNQRRCQPAQLGNGNLQNETIAYLSLASGSGSMVINGENTNYHFGSSQTFTIGGVQDLSYQCGFTTLLTGFTQTPVFVAGKNSRRGGDGGWLRRCQLDNTQVSIAVDEDTFRDSDRRHIWENYSFVAIEKLERTTQCFTDDFERTSLGDDWVVSRSAGSFTPQIIANRMRMTEARGNQATSASYQRLFPGKDNFVEIEFDFYAYGGSGADGVAFVFSDASITPQAGAYGGPLGYGRRSNVNGFAGGWLGFGIDAYGNFSTEGGSNGPGRRRQSVAIRGSGSGTTGYPYLAGACSNGSINPNGECLSPKVDNNNVTPAHRYRITIDSRVDGQSLVKVERNTGAGFSEIVPEFDVLDNARFPNQAAIPEDFILSLTGSTGGATNNHEIDNIEICALESRPIGVQIDHFEFTHDGSGLTCGPETITLKACANADCSQTVPDFVTAELIPASLTDGGWVGGNTVSFSGGSTTLQLNKTTPGNVTIGVASSTPGTKPFSQTLCRVGGSVSAANCTINFADTGFVFDVPDKLAAKPASNILVKAVRKDNQTQQCVPSFANVTKPVSFWSTYNTPAAVIGSPQVTVNSTAIGTSQAQATMFNLPFNASGEATIEVNYPDAGQVTLNARHTGSGDQQGLVMTGSDPFISFPVGLCVTPQDSNAVCSAGNSSCNVYKKAGESFNLQIQGKAWVSDTDTNYCDNPNTPNYAQDNIVLTADLIAPSGGVLGSVTNATYNHQIGVNNTNTVSQGISEVGVFTFSANPPNGYLGSNFYDIPKATSSNIGRFVPDRFVVSNASVLPSCGIFTYMDQPFPVAFNLTAYNVFSAITQNYQGAFAKAQARLVGEDSNNGVELSNRLSGLPISSGSWVAGVASLDSTHLATFSRTIAPNADGPYSAFELGVTVDDNDGGLAFVADPDMRPDLSGDCTTPSNTCTAKRLADTDFRHGRLRMENTYGPEDEVLRMPALTEYWNAGQWTTSALDSCTVLTPPLTGSETYTPVKTTGQTVVRTKLTDISSGVGTLLWQNTGSSAYIGEVNAPLAVDTWLQWYWNYDSATPNLLVNPQASAFFGRYRGHDRIIHWREVK